MHVVGIHVTTIRHDEFLIYEKPDPNYQLMDVMGYISILPKT